MRQVEKLQELPSDIAAFFDDRQEQEMLYRTLHPYAIAGFKQGVKQGKEQTGKRAVEDEFDYQVMARLRRKSLYHAALAIGTTKDELQLLLGTAIAEGQSVQQLAKAIDDYYALESRRRSLVIARTELTDTINDGTLHAIQREGYARKEWSTVLDGREREAHHAANGQIVGINESFIIGGEVAKHPGDDSLSPANRCNCRCTVLASGLPDDRKVAFGKMFLRAHGSLERTLFIGLRHEFDRQRRRVLAHFPAP